MSDLISWIPYWDGYRTEWFPTIRKNVPFLQSKGCKGILDEKPRADEISIVHDEPDRMDELMKIARPIAECNG